MSHLDLPAKNEGPGVCPVVSPSPVANLSPRAAKFCALAKGEDAQCF